MIVSFSVSSCLFTSSEQLLGHACGKGEVGCHLHSSRVVDCAVVETVDKKKTKYNSVISIEYMTQAASRWYLTRSVKLCGT